MKSNLALVSITIKKPTKEMKQKIYHVICLSIAESEVDELKSIDSYTNIDDAKFAMINKASISYANLTTKQKNNPCHIVNVSDYNVSIMDENENGLSYCIVDGTLHTNEFINQKN